MGYYQYQVESLKMPTYAITGGLGSGKTLVAVARMKDYLLKNRRVATNLNLDLEKLIPVRSLAHVVRMQDFPDIKDLQILGRGHYIPDLKVPGHFSKNEKHNGLLVLDECAVFFNSRDWGNKARIAVIAWLRHSRKLGWDVIYIMQDVESIDKQIRKGLIEHEGVCKRSDRLSIPFVGGLLRTVGLGFLSRPPRIHVCSIKYGLGVHALVVDRWMYRGLLVQDGYDTNQVFTEYEDNPDAVAIHSVLSPWHTKGRYMPPPRWQLLKLHLMGTPWRPPVQTHKKPLVSKIMKLPPELRMEFFRRFEACGSI